MGYPYIRKAGPSDYESIWAIWMQDHIIQWMSFTKQKKEDFVDRYKHMVETSDIYVLVDEIDHEEKIVGVRRIKFGKGPYQHTAEYCSMGIDKQYQGKGYAHILYEKFAEIAKEAKIKRIQLTQSGGNERAFFIADRYAFNEEAIFPDWLMRKENGGDFYLLERYVGRIIDEELAAEATHFPSLKFQEVVPEFHLLENEEVTVQRNKDQFICYFKERPILTVDYEPDDSVIKHIGFLSIQINDANYPHEAKQGLRHVLGQILQEQRVKKLDLFTADPKVAEICQELGFFVRGEKIASYFDGEKFKNEVGLEYSFFHIQDAKKLIKAKIPEENRIKTLGKSLQKLSEKIAALKNCDLLGKAYLENILYQMVRDELGPNKVFSLADKKWLPLLVQTPPELHKDLLFLYNALQISHGLFFKKGNPELLSELPKPSVETRLTK